ncbi:MAG TPA: class I SAM-dependent methyltransferase [Candidatus Polarisedimenticolia bacterium]|nr:class I SAM-dependent methyltransferase [Candidatus Polarisedimenticolia bacterium]
MDNAAAGPGTIDTSYDPFSREPSYVELNRDFVRSLELGGVPRSGGIRVLDLACGTGTMTELLLDELRGPDRILGVDLSRASLAHARRRLLEAPVEPRRADRVRLVNASADRLPVLSADADVVLMGNAIHYFKEPGPLLDEVHRVLRPGGLFAFNTSFFAGTFLPGTERFYEEWVKEALKYVLRRDAEERSQGRPGLTRARGRGDAPFLRRWPSPDEYTAALTGRGFAIRSVNRRTAVMTRSSFEAIGAYAGCAGALLSGFPVPLASEALARSVAPVLEATGRQTVPRLWLEVIAVRNGEATGPGGSHDAA